MADNFFSGVNLNKLAAKDPFMADYLAEFISDADYSDLALDGLTAEEIHQIGRDYRDATHYKKTNLTLAKKYFQAAADMGFPAAWVDLGLEYYNDMIPNHEIALRWFQKAADAGESRAMFRLGEMNEYGYGVEQSMKKAFSWYQKSADAGATEAWELLGHKAYWATDEVFFAGKERYARSFECYQKGADLGSGGAMYALAQMYRNGEYTKEEKAKAVEWLEKSVEAGNGSALESLREMYENGKVQNPQYKTAAEWLQSVPYGADAAVDLAYSFRNIGGENPPPLSDYDKATYWYEQAAAKGSINAMRELIELYEHGGKHGEKSTLPIDVDKAAHWVVKAAETGDAAAMNVYSLWLIPPDYAPRGGVQRDEAKSFEWLKKAAVAGSADAMYRLGETYSSGRYGNISMPEDLKLAREWYGKAQEHGNDIAYISIVRIDEESKGEQTP